MTNPANPSTALIPYIPPQSTSQFIQETVSKGEMMVAKGLDVQGKATAELVSKVASGLIFGNPNHPAGRIVADYCYDLQFVDICKTMWQGDFARFYIPNGYRPAFNNTEVRWAVLKWEYQPNLAQERENFPARLKRAQEREKSGMVLKTRVTNLDFALSPDNAAEGLSSADLLKNTDPDIQKKN